MATRTETLKTAVFTLHDESTLTVVDSAEAKNASAALAAFDAYKTAKCVVVGEGAGTYYVPFHSVVKVAVTESASTSTFTDDFCPEEEASPEDSE